MLGRCFVRSTAVLCLWVVLSGCEAPSDKGVSVEPSQVKPAAKPSEAELVLKFSVGDTAKYRVKTETVKDYRFEQPSLGKLDEKRSGAGTEVRFDQVIKKVDATGNAVAKITLTSVNYIMKQENSIKFDFDSEREEDKDKPFARLIGQSYTISMSPDGGVEVVDATRARGVVKEGSASKLAESFLTDRAIIKRHSIPAFPEEPLSVEPGKEWSKIKLPPKGLLAPKTFEKIYTLEKIEKHGGRRFAFIEMIALESDRHDKASGASPLGPLSEMFDTKEDLTGRLVFDLDGGFVSLYKEDLIATYLAAQEAEGQQQQDKGPDTLLMRFTDAITVEKID